MIGAVRSEACARNQNGLGRCWFRPGSQKAQQHQHDDTKSRSGSRPGARNRERRIGLPRSRPWSLSCQR